MQKGSALVFGSPNKFELLLMSEKKKSEDRKTTNV